MPTILRYGPYRIYFYSNESNEPPHVHIDRESSSAKFWIDPVALARNVGFRRAEILDLHQLVWKNRQQFLEKWNEFHHPKT